MEINQTKPVHPKNSRGGVLVLVALLLVVFVGIGALAIDIGFLSTTRNELQNAADAAALAGAGYLGSQYILLSPSEQGMKEFTRAEIVKIVQDAAKENQAGGAIDPNKELIIDSESDIIIGLWDPGTEVVTPQLAASGNYLAPDAVYVKARRDSVANSPISTFFAQIFNIETMPVATEAVAALSGPSIVAPGELQTPFGLSENLFPNNCMDVVNFSPSTSSCAGWHNFGDKIDGNLVAKKLINIIEGGNPCADCDPLSSGHDWLEANFTYSGATAIETPLKSIGDYFPFQGGAIASLLTGVLLDSDYNGETGTVIKTNGDKATNLNSPMPMMALFDYFRYRDGDNDDTVWSTTVPVYKDNLTKPDCMNPNDSKPGLEIVGFARIKIISPNPPPATNLNVQIDCDFIIIEARGGGGSYGNVKGSIPNLVK